MKIFRYLIFDKEPLFDNVVRRAYAAGLTPRMFELFDVPTRAWVDTPASLLFATLEEYFVTYNKAPTADVAKTLVKETPKLSAVVRRGMSDLIDAAVSAPATASEYQFHFDHLMTDYRKQSLIAMSANILTSVEGDSVEELLEDTQQQLTLLRLHKGTGDDPVHDCLTADKFSNNLRKAFEGGNLDAPRAHYGMRDLDALTGGLKPATLTVVAAALSSGKSWIIHQIGYHNIVDLGKSGVIANLEMEHRQIGMRLLVRQTGLTFNKLTQTPFKDFKAEELELIYAAFDGIAEIGDRMLFVPQAQAVTPEMLTQTIEGHYGSATPDIIVADYLELFDTPKRTTAAYERVAEVSRSMKKMAQHFNTPVLTAAQLNAKGLNNSEADITHLSHKQIGKDADTLYIVVPDPDKPYIEPNPGSFEPGTPGNILLSVPRARNHAQMRHFGLKLEVEFATATIRTATALSGIDTRQSLFGALRNG